MNRGSIAMNVMSAANAKTGAYEGPQPKLIDLNARKRMVLTMRIAGISTMASAVTVRAGPGTGYGQAKTVAAATPAADGLGMPTKYRLSSCTDDWILNRASRMAADVK